MAYVTLAFVSVALLLAIVALIKERRLRLALQDILRRLIYRWRNHATTPTHSRTDRHNSAPLMAGNCPLKTPRSECRGPSPIPIQW